MNSEIVNRISENIQKYSFLRDLYLEYSQKKLSPYFVHCEFINQKAVELKFPTEQLEIFVKDLNHIQKQEYFELRNSGNSFCLYLAVLGGNVKKLSIYKPPFDFDIDLHLAHLDSLLLCPNLPSKFYKIFANCKINHLEVYTKNCTIEQLTDLNKILLTVDSVKFSKSITRDFGDIVRIPENVKQLEFYKLNNSKELTMDYSIVKLLENLGKLELKFNHCDLTPQEMDVLKGFLESRRCTSFTFQIDENSINHLESLCLDSILKFAICPRLSVNVPNRYVRELTVKIQQANDLYFILESKIKVLHLYFDSTLHYEQIITRIGKSKLLRCTINGKEIKCKQFEINKSICKKWNVDTLLLIRSLKMLPLPQEIHEMIFESAIGEDRKRLYDKFSESIIGADLDLI